LAKYYFDEAAKARNAYVFIYIRKCMVRFRHLVYLRLADVVLLIFISLA